MTPSGGEKPYRIYRGGRVKGKVPTLPRPGRERDGELDGRPRIPRPDRKQTPRRRRRRAWGRWIALLIVTLLVVLTVWGIASYLAFRDGVRAANARLDRRAAAALTPQDGLLLSHATNILLLGTDHALTRERTSARRSDSIVLLRADPEHHRLTYLSILRDLRVDIPGYGPNKINAAFQFGGPSLAIKTVRAVTGIPINHVVVVDFANFRDLIDELGGITIDVPAPVLSNRFDCPFATDARCRQWKGWRFAKGKQHMDGRRALVYSRIRHNQLKPSESDATRAARQQQVLQAIASKLTGIRTLAHLPFMGADLLAPAATDLTPGQFVQLGWVKFRAGRTLNCRLGGTAYGDGYILGDEESRAVIQMVEGRSAPQPPLPGSLYGSGCFTGGRTPGF